MYQHFNLRDHHFMDGGWQLHPLALVALLVLMVAVCVGAVAAYRYLSGAGHRSGTLTTPTSHADGGAAEDVLRMRLATGEIGEDEFHSRLKALRGSMS